MILGGMTVGVLLPCIPLVIWSFAFRWTFPHPLPTAWSLRQWRYLLAPESQVMTALTNSITVALAVTLLALLIGIPAGRALGLYTFRGKRLVEFLVLAPIIVPGLAVSMGIHIVFLHYHLADTWIGVVLVHLVLAMPYATLMLASVFANYDATFEEQARVLGASSWRAFWLVTLPAILPGVMIGGLFAFLTSWSQYVLTLLIGGGTVVTLPMVLFAFARSGDNGIAAALCLVFIAPVLLLLLVTSRYLSGASTTIRGFGKL